MKRKIALLLAIVMLASSIFALTSLAEGDTVQKLVFYYIIREENMLPDADEYDRIYGLLYDEMFSYYLNQDRESLYSLDAAAYEAELKTLEGEIKEYYGDEYFKEEIYKYYGTRKIIELNKK